MNAARIVGVGRIGRIAMLAVLILLGVGSKGWSMDAAADPNGAADPNAAGVGQPADPQQAGQQPADPADPDNPYVGNNGQGPGYDVYGNKVFTPQQARAMGILNAVRQSGSGNLSTWASMIENQRDRDANTEQAAIEASGDGGSGGSAGINQNFGYGVGTGYPQSNPFGGMPGPIDLRNDNPNPWRKDLERQNYKTVQHAMELDSASYFFQARMVNRAFRDAEAHPYLNPPLPHKPEYTLPNVSQLDLNTGDIHWPSVLAGPEFAGDRMQLQDLFHEWLTGVITPQPIASDVMKVTKDMKGELKQEISHLDEFDFATGSHFLDSLLYAAHQPKPVNYGQQVARVSQASIRRVSNSH